jgi:hypothetical protein
MKLNARVLKAAHGTEVFLTSPDAKGPQVNTVMRLPAESGPESGLYTTEINFTPVVEAKEEAKKS